MSLTTTILGGAVQLSANPIRIKISGGTKPANTSKYKYLFRVISEDGKLYGAPFEEAVAPDINGEAILDISGLVDQPIQAIFQYPVTTPYVNYPTQAFNIQIQQGETWVDEDDVLQESWGTVSSIFQLLKGGSSPRQRAIWNSLGTNFYETYINSKRFLTMRPQGDIVHPSQPVKLWFMPVSNITCDYNVKGFYDDGTNVEYQTSVNLNVDSLTEFNCNPANLGLQLEPTGKRMLYFDVCLKVNGIAISDTRNFYFDWRYCERPYFLLFANSIGGIDDVFMAGYATEDFSVTSTTMQKPQKADATVFEPTLFNTKKEGQNIWSLNTGPKTSTQMLHLRDLLLAGQIWILYPTLNVTTKMIIPVNISEFSDTLIDRLTNLWSANIKVYEAHMTGFSFDNRLTL